MFGWRQPFSKFGITFWKCSLCGVIKHGHDIFYSSYDIYQIHSYTTKEPKDLRTNFIFIPNYLTSTSINKFLIKTLYMNKLIVILWPLYTTYFTLMAGKFYAFNIYCYYVVPHLLLSTSIFDKEEKSTFYYILKEKRSLPISVMLTSGKGVSTKVLTLYIFYNGSKNCLLLF